MNRNWVVVICWLALSASVMAGSWTGAAAYGKDGQLFVLEAGGALKTGSLHQELLPSVGSNVLPMDIAVVGEKLVVAVRDDYSPQGRLEIFSSTGQKLHQVMLADRLWPQRVDQFGSRVAVLGSTPEEGVVIDFLDQKFVALAGTRLYASFNCDELDLADMAVGHGGIWVAPLAFCESGYLVRKYDASGSILLELSGVLDKPTDGDVMAIKDVFTTPTYVGVVLNVPGEQGVQADLWTPSGSFVKRVTFSGVFSGVIRAFSTADELTVVGIDENSIDTFSLPKLMGDGR